MPDSARYSLIAHFAMTRAALTADEMRAALRHATTCICEACRKFNAYASVKDLVEAWEEFKRVNTPGVTP